MNLERHLKKLQAVSLSDTEKQDVRDALQAYVSYHPVRPLAKRAEFLRTYERQGTLSWLHISRPFSERLSTVLAGFFVFALVGGGVSFAAEGSMPGSTLYPIKVDVIEEVRSWVLINPEAKAAWEARRVERRLEEAISLAATGELSADARTELATRFKSHARSAATRLAKLDSQAHRRVAARMSSELESSLRAHEHVLLSFEETEDVSATATMMVTEDLPSRIAEAEPLRGAEASPLVAEVRLSIGDISAIRIRTESELSFAEDTEASVAESERASAEGAIRDAKAVVIERSSERGKAVRVRAEEKIAFAEAEYAEALKNLESDKLTDAIIGFHEAVRAATEASILIRARSMFDEGRHAVEENGEAMLHDPTNNAAGGASVPGKLQGSSVGAKASSSIKNGASSVNVLIDTRLNVGTTTKGTATGTTSTSTSVKITNKTSVKNNVSVKINTGNN